jgi:flagellar basal-body rod modification protein FlgD
MTTITGTGTSTTGTASGTSMAKLSSNFETFLTLLTTQLKNQDPTAPMDSNQFTQQLVQFSQVEQQIETNTNLSSLLTQGQAQTAAYATSYLGKAVSVTNGYASLANGEANWSYTLDAAAGETGLTVTDATGKVVFTGMGDKTKGSHAFAWNGKDNNGNKLPDGAYKLTVTAAATDGAKVGTAVASAGMVGQIDMTGGAPKFVIGNMTASLGEIAAVGN